MWETAGPASCFKGDLKGLWRADAGSSRRRRLISGVDIVWVFFDSVVIKSGDCVSVHYDATLTLVWVAVRILDEEAWSRKPFYILLPRISVP